MKKVSFFTFITLCFVILGCKKKEPKCVEIAVISDPHYFATSLIMSDGSTYRNALAQEGRMMEESGEIFRYVVEKLARKTCPNVVLISGDLTHNGDAASHALVTRTMREFLSKGIKVVVVPGNHDVDNPEACVYNGDATISTSNVSAEQFKIDYHDYGYGDAVEYGPDLCYVSEPAKDLWIIAIDANRYQENVTGGKAVVGGKISQEKLDWIVSMIKRGKKEGKKVLGLMHHGLLEHFEGQKEFFPDFVVEDGDRIAETLSNAGLKVIFTGHFHAQDIAQKKTERGFIYDIETGSLAASPCSYRKISLIGNSMRITKQDIKGVEFFLNWDRSAQDVSREITYGLLKDMIKSILINPPYSIPAEQADQLTPLGAETFLAHYNGDEKVENMSDEGKKILEFVNNTPELAALGRLVNSMWSNNGIRDNNVTIDLKTGVAN